MTGGLGLGRWGAGAQNGRGPPALVAPREAVAARSVGRAVALRGRAETVCCQPVCACVAVCHCACVCVSGYYNGRVVGPWRRRSEFAASGGAAARGMSPRREHVASGEGEDTLVLAGARCCWRLRPGVGAAARPPASPARRAHLSARWTMLWNTGAASDGVAQVPRWHIFTSHRLGGFCCWSGASSASESAVSSCRKTFPYALLFPEQLADGGCIMDGPV